MFSLRSILSSLVLLAAAAAAHGQIDPNQINWPLQTQAGAPSGGSCTSANFGQGDVDTTNNLFYFCTTSGWTTPPSAGSVVASINGSPGSFTFTGSGVSCSSTTCTFAGTSPSNGTVQTGTFTVTNQPFVQMNCSSACTVHLPASVATGFAVAIMATGAGAVTIDPNGVTYDGATSIPTRYTFVTVWTDGTGYHSSTPITYGSGTTFTCTLTGCTLTSSGGSSGLSGMTATQVPIAATASTVTSSKPLAGAGSGITTGPTSAGNTNCAQFTGTAGQIADSGAPCPSTGLSGMTSGQVPIANSASTINTSLPLGGLGTRITTGPSAPTSTDCAEFTGTAGQIADAGYPCGTNSRAWSCQPGFGDGTNATAAATYLATTCKNTTGSTVTITGIQCFTDNNGSSTLNATDNSTNALLTGAVTCTTSFAAGTQSAHTTIGNNGFINFTYVADGVSKQSTWVVNGTY